MTFYNFPSAPSATGSQASGSEEIFVVGTFHVAAAQVSGLYTNAADLVVTVNYN